MTRDTVVVDDEPEKSAPLVRYLQGEGYGVRFACSGAEALELIGARRPDCVICDLEMPNMSGYSVMAALGKPFVLVEVGAFVRRIFMSVEEDKGNN